MCVAVYAIPHSPDSRGEDSRVEAMTNPHSHLGRRQTVHFFDHPNRRRRRPVHDFRDDRVRQASLEESRAGRVPKIVESAIDGRAAAKARAGRTHKCRGVSAKRAAGTSGV
jgi:hypothetical protein